jgi:GST-like protein
MWQMGGLGPMAGQAHHFRQYASEQIPYAIARYTDEANRLYGVLDSRLADREFIAGAYSIADMASWPWVVPYERQGQTLEEFPYLKRWFETIRDRPAVQRGFAVGRELREAARAAAHGGMDDQAKKILFGQRARPRSAVQ